MTKKEALEHIRKTKKRARTLQAHMERFEKEFVEPLNKNVMKQERQPGNVYQQVLIYEDLNWQKIPNDADAFDLKSPVSGFIKNRNVPADVYLKRFALGYALVLRMGDSDYNYFVKCMLPILISAKDALLKLKGFGPETYSTGQIYLKRPGKNAEYFREMENTAAFELRAYSDCVETNILMGKLEENTK